MKMRINKKLILAGVFVLFIITGCHHRESFDNSDTFIKDFEQRKDLLSQNFCFEIFNQELSNEQCEALQFLYAYMPLPDIVDYSGEFHKMNVDYALKSRREMAWGNQIPDREFLHFVLPLRVNNENLDEFRNVYYEELKDRIENLSMYDAVLEINHWCHERVTYTPSDARTSSPLASIQTAYGRCGEESTLTVTALRTVGIPARQVYTPRWAHTDSNHAWVEAWVDGEWHFLGACEPEPVLDLGWFNAPASRGMLMHTNVFGQYYGPEEVVGRNACYTEINVTANYAPTATTTIHVVDEYNKCVSGAVVDFKIYNYAEFYTAASKVSDNNGVAFLTTGCGDMVVWASKDGKFGFAKVSAGKEDSVTIVLDKSADYRASLALDIEPPIERNTVPALTPQQIAMNTERLSQEDSIRNAYVASFPTEEEIALWSEQWVTDKQITTTLIKQSRGNYRTLMTFIEQCNKDLRSKALALLCTLSEKDLRDVSIEVLNDHFAAVSTSDNEQDYYYQYVLCPRVSNELLTPYRAFFASVISDKESKSYQEHPESWVEWCKQNIMVDNTWNPRMFCMSPQGVWNIRMADTHSRNIFFVAAARSMGIPARIDEVTGKTQYMNKQLAWCDVDFESAQQPSVATGSLQAHFTPTTFIDNPQYGSHFSISKIVDGEPILFNYPDQTSWKSLLRNGVSLDTGRYLLVSGTRMANGGVLAQLHFVTVQENKVTQMELIQRENRDALQVIGDFDSEKLYFNSSEGVAKSFLSTTGRGYYIVALIDPNSEPTNHFLRDMISHKELFEKWGRKIVVLFENTDAENRFIADDFPNLPETIVWGTDIENDIYNAIASGMKLPNNNKPIIIVADTFNRVVFLSQGYSIGLGEQLSKVINQLQK